MKLIAHQPQLETQLAVSCLPATEPPVQPHILKTKIVIAVLFGGFGLWAAFAPLTSTAVAPGVVKVDSHRKTVQHLEGGIVREILVREGDAVGQALVTLDDADANLNAIGGQIGALVAETSTIKEQVPSLEEQLRDERTLERTVFKMKGDIEANENRLLSLREQQRKTQARAARDVVTAPQDGVVMDLRITHTLGGVFPPGVDVLDLIPTGDKVVLDVTIQPIDIDVGTSGPKPTTAPAGAIILHAGDNVSAIVNAAPVGATFFFGPGIYRGVSIIPKTGQTFIGAESAILNGSAVLTNFTQQGNFWTIGGQTQQGVRHATDAGDGVSMRPGYPETVFINDTPLKPVDALPKVVPGAFYFDYAADKIYIAENPRGQKVEAGKLTYAFRGNAQNVTVQNLVIEKYDPPVQSGTVQGNKGWIIQDNEVRLNYAVGIKVEPGENSKIIGNYVHDNGQLGLGGSGNDILVEGNEIAKNGFWSGIDVLWEGGGFKFANTNGLIVRGNYSHDNHGPGMWTDINNIHTLYENNLVVHNTHIGITHEISYDAVIRNNTLIGNGYGDPRGWLWGAEIQIQNSKNVDVYGNRIDMTGGGNGVVLIQQNRGSGTYGPYVTTGNHIHDNVIVDHDNTGNEGDNERTGNCDRCVGGVADYNWAGMANGGNTWSYNQYYMPDVGNRFWWGETYNFAGFKNVTHETGSVSQAYPNTDDWLRWSSRNP